MNYPKNQLAYKLTGRIYKLINKTEQINEISKKSVS